MNKLFLQCKHEIKKSLDFYFKSLSGKELIQQQEIFNYLCIPDRTIEFKVCWYDDSNKLNINKCWRVQQSNILGPYKGGLRFHPGVDLDTISFLALEQTFKCALTGQNMGGAKGGSDFTTKGKSRSEIKRFSDAFMTEMLKYTHSDIDVPAGDIGVNSELIGILYGSYLKISGGVCRNSIITGKPTELNGCTSREKSTGFGLVHITETCLKDKYDTDLQDKRVIISGCGNVATHAAKSCIHKGSTVLTLSDINGVYYCEEGMKIEDVDLCNKYERGLVSTLPNNITYIKNKTSWDISYENDLNPDIVLTCATQNELSDLHAKKLLGCKNNNLKVIAEGSNMGCTDDAINIFDSEDNNVTFLPSKLANMGGVSCSSLEMSQNYSNSTMSEYDADEKIKQIMDNGYLKSVEYAKKYNTTIIHGANIYAFKRLSDALISSGHIL